MPESQAKAASRGNAGSRSDAYKPYLDGLRAIAVGGVVVYHLNRLWLPGGYLGVDLFFVLSGYLITTLLVTEQTRTGAINLLGFWSRRVRRLLPALLLLLLALSIEIWLSGDQLAAASARGDFLATLFYFANWHFISSDQSYFTQYVAVSPVRHTWSLAIEEQFYIGWPLVVALVVRRGGLRALASVALVLSLASMAAMWLVYDASSDPSRAYYGTDTRIFEILFGAVLAVVLTSRWRGRALAVTKPLAIPALIVVVVDMLLLADDSTLYYRGAAAAVAGACVVLISGL
jgi:peptidoglycan/LPS O-acetylase OafA/YrhL